MKNLRFPSLIAALSLIILSGGCKDKSSSGLFLPRSTPEAEGVSSAALITFLDSVEADRHEFHSIMIVRHGKVVAEGWWDPYKPDLRHTLYSTSKSFTSTAVGFAVTEKLLSVNDRVVSFFPDQLPDTVSPYLEMMTVRDLLTMSAGQSPDPTGAVTNSCSEWVKGFLATPVLKEPGTEFLYNSLATFMLSAIVQKVTGEKIADYLQPRLFGPLGIQGYDWEESPDGINAGGWGLRVRTEDMAKFGLLYLQKGVWNGKQIIPAEWVEEATTFKIDQAPDEAPEVKAKNDWMQGYCYQFWRSRNNAFRADGAFGQYIIVMPEKDAVVAITCESPDMQDEINLVWDHLLPALQDGPLPEDKESLARLKERLTTLALPMPADSPDSPLASQLSGKKFLPADNTNDPGYFNALFNNDTCTLSMKTNGQEFKIPFGRGKWVISETGLAGPNLINRPDGNNLHRIAAAYEWSNDSTLEMIIRYIESPHHIKVKCSFEGDTMVMNTRLSTPPGYDMPPMKAVMEKQTTY
jgi:CubicO group peptidase (beta-lactamase class C family)